MVMQWFGSDPSHTNVSREEETLRRLDCCKYSNIPHFVILEQSVECFTHQTWHRNLRLWSVLVQIFCGKLPAVTRVEWVFPAHHGGRECGSLHLLQSLSEYFARGQSLDVNCVSTVRRSSGVNVVLSLIRSYFLLQMVLTTANSRRERKMKQVQARNQMSMNFT